MTRTVAYSAIAAAALKRTAVWTRRLFVGDEQASAGPMVTIFVSADAVLDLVNKNPKALGKLIDQRCLIAARQLRELIRERTGVRVP